MGMGKTRRAVLAMGRYIGEPVVCLVDSDNLPINGQDDADIDLRDAVRLVGEVVPDTITHLLGASGVETEIALGATPELLLVVDAAVNAVRVRPQVEHGCAGNRMEVVDQGVERCPTVGFPSEQMDAAGWTKDVLLGEQAALTSDHVNLGSDDAVNSRVVAREYRVPLLGRASE